MTAKERKARAGAVALERATRIYGTATLADGTEKPVRLWAEALPWWGRADVEQRRAWLAAFFARQLGVKPEDVRDVKVRVQC